MFFFFKWDKIEKSMADYILFDSIKKNNRIGDYANRQYLVLENVKQLFCSFCSNRNV